MWSRRSYAFACLFIVTHIQLSSGSLIEKSGTFKRYRLPDVSDPPSLFVTAHSLLHCAAYALRTSLVAQIAVSYENDTCTCNIYMCGTMNFTAHADGEDAMMDIFAINISPNAQLINLALDKPVELSSYYGSAYIQPGNDGKFNNDGFFCTQNEMGGWWRVDLTSIYCVSAVNLTNRQGELDRVNDVLVTISEETATLFYSTNTSSNLCGSVPGQMQDYTYMACSKTLAGRFVQVQNSLTISNHFHLVEVQVFGF